MEFALVVPVLFALLLGTIEFGWAFFQNLDVRHGAREAGRLAAVDFGTGGTADLRRASLVAEACTRLDEKAGVDIGIVVNGSGVGGEVTVTISKPLNDLTGAFRPFVGGKTLRSTIVTRLEQPATFSNEPVESLPGNDCP